MKKRIKRIAILLALFLFCTGIVPAVADSTDIVTKTYGYQVLADYYYTDAAGNAVFNEDYALTDYQYCRNGFDLTVRTPGNAEVPCGIAFYDENRSFVSFVPAQHTGVDAQDENIAIPGNAWYFRASYYATRQNAADFRYKISFYANDYEAREYNRYTYFSVKVDQENLSFDTALKSENVKCTTGVLALPDGYSPNGTKTPLIVYFHGSSHGVSYGRWGATDDFLNQKENFLNAGFAVLDCNGARNTDLEPYVYPGCPQAVNAYKACVDYVCKNYNIDESIFVLGASAGSATAMNYFLNCGSVAASVILSPNTSILPEIQDNYWNISSWRKAYVEYYCFNGTSVFEREKAEGFDPYLRIVNNDRLDFSCPVYFINEVSGYEPTDTLISKLREHGKEVLYKEFLGYSHSQLCSGGDIESDTFITDYFRSVITENHEHNYTREITMPPTCTAEGTATYTCVCGDSYTEKILPTEHDYETDFIWTGNACTASFLCRNCGSTRSVVCDVTSTVNAEATTSAPGIRTYTATVCIDGKTYTSIKTETIPQKDNGNNGNKKASVFTRIIEFFKNLFQKISAWFSF